MDKELPITYGRLTPNPSYPGSWLIRIKCPYCPKTHTHGWPKGSGRTPQTRVPHCVSKYGGPGPIGHDYMIAPDPSEYAKIGSDQN